MRKRPFVQVLHTRQCGENEIEQLLSCLLMPPLNPMRLLNKLCTAACLGLILRAEERHTAILIGAALPLEEVGVLKSQNTP